jgi:ABC-2 type transport system ATP-binding protein
MLRTDALSKDYGRHQALRGLSIALKEGEIGGLLGLNGAGKTTAMHLLATFQQPTGGSAVVAGHDVVLAPALARRSIGFLPESNQVALPHWTPYEFLEFFAARHGFSRAETRLLIERNARALDFGSHLHKSMAALSGGTRRKVDMVRALLADPPVLLLDEPTREMDIPTKRDVWRILEERAKNGTTILLASHDALEIRRLCRTVTVLRQGEVVFDGPVGRLEREGAFEGGIDAPLAQLLSGRASA